MKEKYGRGRGADSPIINIDYVDCEIHDSDLDAKDMTFGSASDDLVQSYKINTVKQTKTKAALPVYRDPPKYTDPNPAILKHMYIGMALGLMGKF
jgi:hypothetical protein